MTPRTVMKIASEKMKIEHFYNENPNLKFSRIPIYVNNTDEISGYFLKDNLLEAIIKGNGEKKPQIHTTRVIGYHKKPTDSRIV